MYPLWSPQSLLAEGTADAAWDTIFPGEEGRAFLRDQVAPLAGFTDREAVEAYLIACEALEGLKGVRPVAARMLLDEGKPEGEVRTFLMRYGLMDREHAERAIAFIREYRAYVFTYVVGRTWSRPPSGRPARTPSSPFWEAATPGERRPDAAAGVVLGA